MLVLNNMEEQQHLKDTGVQFVNLFILIASQVTNHIL